MLRALIIGLATATLTAGCASDASKGWTIGSAYSDQWKTIAIPIVKNTTYEREVGYLLTNALIREVENRTPWRVTSAAEADTLLEVEITEVELRALSQSRLTKLDQETLVEMQTNWTWEDLSSNRTITAWDGMGSEGLFLSSNPLEEPIELGKLQAVENMARAIVDRMTAAW